MVCNTRRGGPMWPPAEAAYCLDPAQPLPQSHAQETEDHAEDHITPAQQPLPLLQQGQALQGEGGEGGEGRRTRRFSKEGPAEDSRPRPAHPAIKPMSTAPSRLVTRVSRGNSPRKGKQAEPPTAHGPQGAARPHRQKAGYGHQGTPFTRSRSVPAGRPSVPPLQKSTNSAPSSPPPPPSVRTGAPSPRGEGLGERRIRTGGVGSEKAGAEAEPHSS